MPYIVSARRYRPQTFKELIGQEHIASTLQNAITKRRVGHAYLFSGPRGIGKTSAARIFAKALNCEQGPTPTPCNKCSVCREITEGRALDLVEIDGASNRRIDEIRQLRENVRFVPSVSRYKIYIIDEVHMLTTEAFNALLKTLEEPPGHIIFIFATTELNKVPQTIRSRCQQFVFKRIPIPLIVDMLKSILDDLKVEAEPGALFWIARSALGSMRDAESILDQMVSYSDGMIKEQDVFYVLGMPNYDIYHTFAQAIAQEDFKSCFTLLDQLIKEGLEVITLISGLIDYFKNLYVLSVDGLADDLIDLPLEDIHSMKNLLPRYTKNDIQNILMLLSKCFLDTRNSELTRELFEITLIKLVHYRDVIHPSSLVKRMEELGREMGKISANPSGNERGNFVESSPQKILDYGKCSSSALAEDITRHFAKKRRALAEFLMRAKSYTLENNILTISYGQKEKLSYEHVSEASARRYIEKEIRNLLQKDIRMNVKLEEDNLEPPEGDTLSEDISMVMEIFKGEIVSNNNFGG